MTKVIISYSLFDQKDKKFDRSGHDQFNRVQNRYWLNIPFILLINKICIPNSETHFYVPKDLENNNMFFLLDKLNKDNYLKLHIINKSHSGTEPTIWRMMGLWEKDTDFCFCRDMDSVLSYVEVKSMLFFMCKDFWINNIRTVKQHNSEGTSLMAGLNGFNIKQLQENLPLPKTFEKYEEFYKKLAKKSFFLNWRADLRRVLDKDGQWGCDQETLVTFFIKSRSDRITKKVLDVYAQPSHLVPKIFQGRVQPNKHYNVTSIDVNTIPDTILSSFDKRILPILNNTISWGGQPVSANGNHLAKLLAIKNKNTDYMSQLLSENKLLKNFYAI